MPSCAPKYRFRGFPWAAGFLDTPLEPVMATLRHREAQYRFAFDNRQCLVLAQGLIEAKVRNTRTMLRRNWRAEPEEREEALVRLQRMAKRATRTKDAQELLGIEGEAAAVYFGRFESMLATEIRDRFPAFAFEKRNRRPPTDPVNAMLSFAYALLTRIFTTTISATGLDPYMGFYHRPRHGRPALAQSIQGHEGLWPLVATICFPVPLTARRHAEMAALPESLIKPSEDHILIIDIGFVERISPRVESLGKVYETPTRQAVMFNEGGERCLVNRENFNGQIIMDSARLL